MHLPTSIAPNLPVPARQNPRWVIQCRPQPFSHSKSGRSIRVKIEGLLGVVKVLEDLEVF